MRRRPFGKTGLEISPIGFGGAPIGYLETEQQRVGQILNFLLDNGVNLIDTATGYVGSEEAIGKAVSHRRDEFILVSKGGRALDGLPGAAWSEELILATIERSLKRLRTDCIDVMLLHSCDLETLKKGEAIAALVKARDAGKIRFAGYSGDNEAAAFAVTHPDIAVLETSINIVDQANIDSVLPVAQKQNVGVMTKRSVANAAWRPMQEQHGFYEEYAKPYHERFAAMGLTLEELGANDWAEVALRFTLSQPAVHCALIGTTKPENAKKNIEFAKRGPLDPKVFQQIRNRFKRAADGKDWMALT